MFMKGPTSLCIALIFCHLLSLLETQLTGLYQQLIGPLQTIPSPRPVYLDHTPPLLTKGYGEFDLYQDSIRNMLYLLSACCFYTMGGLI
jgi:hypothetical protein